MLTLSGRIYSPIENYSPISNATGQFPRTLSLPQTKEYVIPEEVIREVTEMYRAKGQILLSAGSSQFTLEGISIEEKLVEGADIAETIISEVESGNFDLIIMGRSSNEEKELDSHLGSVTAKVSSHVKTPILIVRRKTAIRKLLIAVDGSVENEKALQEAFMIAKAAGAKVVLLHVQETSLINLRPEIREIGLQILKNAAIKIEGIKSEEKLLSGDPAIVIVQTAKEADVDLIVVGRGGQGRLRNFFLGSVSGHVLHHATVPILIVKK